MIVTLTEAKRQVNEALDVTDNDDYITSLIQVAEEAVEQELGASLLSYTNDSGEMPRPIRQCILLLVANLYANREPVSYAQAHEVLFAYKYLLSLYRHYN